MTEEAFLDAQIGKGVAVYLINGIKLLGILKDHDAEVVFLRPRDAHGDGTEMMISKAAISTVLATLSTNERNSSDSLGGILARPTRIPVV